MLPGMGDFVGFAQGGGGLTLSVIPSSSISKTTSTSGSSKTFSTSNVTVVPAGGSGSYTYAWTRLTGFLVTASAPSAATTAFTATLSADTSVSVIMRCTVTDTVTGQILTIDVTVSMSLIYVSPGGGSL